MVDWFVIALLALALTCIAVGYMLRALQEEATRLAREKAAA